MAHNAESATKKKKSDNAGSETWIRCIGVNRRNHWFDCGNVDIAAIQQTLNMQIYQH